VVAGSLNDLDTVIQAAQDVEVIYHIAGRMPRRDVDYQDVIRANVQGTDNLLRAGVAGNAPHFIFSSSVGVYGLTPFQRVAEEIPLEGRGLYREINIEAERLIQNYSHKYGLEHAILRLSHVYGPGAPYFIKLLRQFLNYPLLSLWQSADRIVQWVHVRDVA
jgi:nucleoside-diphosphate-sugar epimerase